MQYAHEKYKSNVNGDIYETVILTYTDKIHPEIMAGYELVSFDVISREKAIELCGEEAILNGEEEQERRREIYDNSSKLEKSMKKFFELCKEQDENL